MNVSEKLKGLKNFNLFMALLHFVQGVAMLFLAKNFTLPINVGFLNFDYATQKLVSASETIYSLPLVWLIAGFLFMSAIAHLIIATVYNKTYNENLEKGINKARWIEYAFSASTMMVAISMLVGIYDLGSLIMIFALTAAMNLLGLLMEVHNQTTEKTSWLSYYIGCFAGAIPWIVVAIFFYAANKYGTGQIPTFVYWIYVSIFLFFNCFAINMVLQYKKIGAWQDYLYGERVYIILSLVAKSLLAWQVYAGTLRP
jgi:VanZ family protein